MQTLHLVCLMAVLCGAVTNARKDDNKVKIAVYYESLCPDSQRFITTQLALVWRDFRGEIQVELVPYGKATHENIDGKWQFTCQHGPEECYGNKVQACILKDRNIRFADKMTLVTCLMGNDRPDKALDTCFETVKKSGSSRKVKKCASGEQGDRLLASFGEMTDLIEKPLSFVPTVVVNQGVQTEALEDLKAVICRVAENKPSAC